jgi:hypothetical protein
VIIRMQPGDARCWSLVPLLCLRMLDFRRTMGESNGDGLVRDFMICFVKPVIPQATPPEMVCWVAVEATGRIVMHVLAEVSLDHGEPLVVVTQWVVDAGFEVSAEERAEVLAGIEALARERGARRWGSMAKTEAHVRLYRRQKLGLEPIGIFCMKGVGG